MREEEPAPWLTPVAAAADIDEQEIHLFLLAGRLLIEHSEATPRVEHTLYNLAAKLGREIRVTAGYRDLTIFLLCGDHFEGRVSRFTPELKINMRMITHVHDTIRRLTRREATLEATIEALERLAAAPPHVNRWLAASMLAVAAASLAGTFGGDRACVATVALVTGLGVLLRQELARRRFNMFFLPFAAALLGALIGGVVDNAGLTTTTDVCLLVPSLVLVPGVHMLNAAYDLFENHMPIALARSALSLSIMGSIAFGLILGAAATGNLLPLQGSTATVPFAIGLALAALASAGFGIFFNVPFRLLPACVLCGVAGHAARDLGADLHLHLTWSTLLASTVVGVLTALLQLVETAVAGLNAGLVLLAIAVGLLAPVTLIRRIPAHYPVHP